MTIKPYESQQENLASAWKAYPVRGEGREARMETVTQFLHSRFSQQARDPIYESIQNGTYKCRLVFEENVAKGVFVHGYTPHDDIQPLRRCITFQAFGLLDPSGSHEEIAKLFQAATASAQEEGGRCISLSVSRNDPLVYRSLLSLGCEPLSSVKDLYMLSKSLLDGGKKRKAEEAPQPPSAAAVEPKTTRVPLKDLYIRQIESGKKTVEGRINKGMFARIKVGQSITFFNQVRHVVCTVRSIAAYKDFQSMLANEGYENCVNEAKSLHDAIRIYHDIPSYQNLAKTHGVVAIRIEKQ